MTLRPKLYNQYCNSSQQCSKKGNFFDAPNSNFPLLNWLDIIVHRIESICTDRPMSRLHISVLENRHVQLLYRPTYQFSRKLLRNKVFFLSLLCQKILEPDFLSTFLVVPTCFGLLMCCTMSHKTQTNWNCKFCFPTQLSIKEDSLNLIPSPSPSVKIQIIGGKVYLRK